MYDIDRLSLYFFYMPLIVVCGIPGSGKTKRANEVAEYLREKHGKHVVVVNEENLGINKQLAYSSTGSFSQTRKRRKSQEEG